LICFGEIIWDCLPTGKVLGGAQLNMSVQMHNIGLIPTLVTAVGKDDLGEEMLNDVKALGLDIASLAQIDKYPTSRVDIILDDQGRATYDIKMPVAWDAIPITKEHFKIAEDKGVIFGSMAQRMDDDSYHNLDLLLEHSTLNFFDANFRLPFTTKELLVKYLPHSHIFKINDEELPILMKWMEKSYDEDDGLNYLSDEYSIDHIILTKGAEGSKILSKGIFHQHGGYKVDVDDTVGCGDAFTAGFVFGVKKEWDMNDVQDFASALSAVVASKKGGCCLTSLAEVNALRASRFN
tara:strand:- start:1684 stop:2562 length:879 start_codon:yes stop_codon:yes gene_type:complete